MKIVFTKLKTSNKNIYIDFNNGEGWKEYTVADAKENGINIPDNCTDFSKIKIKGKTDVFTNTDVIFSAKVNNIIQQDGAPYQDLWVSKDSISITDEGSESFSLGNSDYYRLYADVDGDYYPIDNQTIYSSKYSNMIEGSYMSGNAIQVGDNSYIFLTEEEVNIFRLKDEIIEPSFEDGKMVSVSFGSAGTFNVVEENDKLAFYVGDNLFNIAEDPENGYHIDFGSGTIYHEFNSDQIIDVGSNVCFYESGSGAYGTYYSIGSNISGKDKLIEDFDNQPLYYYVGSGQYLETNLKIKFN